MNNDKMKSSNQNPLNTTHFNNNINRKNITNNNRPIGIPKNTSFNNNLDNSLETNIIPDKQETNKHVNLSNEEKQQQSRNYLDNSIDDNNDKPKEQVKSKNISKNQFGPKNIDNIKKINNNTNNIRNALNTNPSMKDQVVKKGNEALKKSTNPYFKAIGYANSMIQKRNEKKKENEEKNQEAEPEVNNNIVDEEQTETQKKQILIKKILPLIMLGGPFLIIMIIILCIVAPILDAYSWFYSAFNHNTEEASDYYIYKNDDVSKDEQDFNNAVFGSKDGSVTGIIQKYKDEYGVTLNRHLLMASVTYKYTVNQTVVEKEVEDITEDEINENLDELEENNNDSKSVLHINQIDYKSAKNNLETVAKLMLIQDGDTYKTDFSVGGAFYNNLINSSFLTSYYKDFLKDNNYNTKKELVDKIFDYAEGSKEIFGEDEVDDEGYSNGGVIGDFSTIHVQTCKVPYTYTEINNMKIYNNPPWNEGTSYPDTLSMVDYIKGVLMGEVGGHVKEQYIEGLKAQAIVAFTYIINDKKSGFDLKSGEMYFPAGNCRQLTCSPTDGCTYIKGKTEGKYGTAFVGPNRFGSEGRNIQPFSSEDNAILDKVMSEIFGLVMVNKGVTSATFSGSKDTIHTSYYDSVTNGSCVQGKCFGQKEAFIDNENGMNFEQILHKYYSDIDFDIINIVEGQYTENAEFADAKFNGKIIYYSQTNYKNKFCGISNETIATSGCGVTAAAIVASSLTGNKKYDPIYMMDWAYKDNYCGEGIFGTLSSFFSEVATKLGYKYDIAEKKDVNKVVNALKSGNSLVIAHVGTGHFTDGSHFIVLSQINSEGKVYVYDPYNNRGTGFWDLNLIANELEELGYFHIISLK